MSTASTRYSYCSSWCLAAKMSVAVEWANQPLARKSMVATSSTKAVTYIEVVRIQFLRDIKTCFGTAFKVAPADPADATTTDLLYSCYGIGYVNANRTLT